MTATLYTDGAALGNPGPSGLGIVLYGDDGQLIAERSIPAGTGTNNEAEYRALIEGLRLAAEHGIRELTARLDSMLVVKQMAGEWKVREARLAELKRVAAVAAGGFDHVRFEHVPRERNTRADALSKAGAEAASA